MEIRDYLSGFELKYNKELENVEILDFPHFPQETLKSKNLFYQLEKINFTNRKIEFPIRFNIIQRIVDVDYNNIEFFSISDLFNLIEQDKNRFINTDTFFKVSLEYQNKSSFISIIYYTLSETGETKINNINNLLDFVNIHYDTKKFTKKFINPRKLRGIKTPNDIEHIPLIPLLWLDYDENNNLIYFNHFKLIEDDKNLSF